MDKMFKRKRGFKLMLFSAVLSAGMLCQAQAANFSDVPENAWYRSTVLSLTETGAISGYPDGTFQPERGMSRIEFCKVLEIAFPESEAEKIHDMDVAQAELGELNPGFWGNQVIINSYMRSVRQFGKTQAEWEKPISRAEIAMVITAFYSYQPDNPTHELYADTDLIDSITDASVVEASPYKMHILWCYTAGILGGDTQGKFNPTAGATRAEACTSIIRTIRPESRIDKTKPTNNVPAPAVGAYISGSVYGPSLSTEQLAEVQKAVQSFTDTYRKPDMSDYERVRTAYDYLIDTCASAPDWSKNEANSAWGALVYHEAQCSGYARAMKALCDAMGIECYYVHADATASNPSHQWNVVKVDGNWYIIDAQLNDSSGGDYVFLASDARYCDMTGLSWDTSKVPACYADYE